MRNAVAHVAPVEAGNMRIFLEPGLEPHIELDGGGEELPLRGVGTPSGVRLGVALEGQLAALTDAIFELLNLLPDPAHGLDVDRLR